MTKRFIRRIENFKCEVCAAEVKGSGYTDHCPNCLYSKHVDTNPGDRAATCGGLMKPLRTEYDGENFVIHYRCQKCGIEKHVMASGNDNKKLLEALLSKRATAHRHI